MAEQLASVPEESNNDFTAPSPPCYSYRESFMSFAGPEWRIRSTLSSQSGQSGSNRSSISAAGPSSSYLFNISSLASAGAADFGADELHQGRPSIHEISSRLEKKPASVPEDSTAGFTAPSPPSFSYRELIQSLAWPEWSIISTLSSQSGESGSSYSGASSSYLSNNTSYSSRLGSAGKMDFPAGELTEIAHRMVSDGYTKHMVQAFGDGGGQYRDLKNWFVELDVEWVLQIGVHKSPRYWGCSQQYIQLLLGNTSASWHRELIEKWVRAFTIIVASIKKELVAAVHPETWAVAVALARFGEASISSMLVFVEPILDVFKVVNLPLVLHMYVCVSNASYDMSTLHTHSLIPISWETQSIFTKISVLLNTKGDNLIKAISTTMNKVRMTLYDDNDSWAIEILRGRGEVHTNVRLMVDYILLMRKTHASTQNSTQSQNTGELRGLIQRMINDLNYMLLQKSELCPDPNLRYLFLLNNSYFVAHKLSSLHHPRLKLIPECERYMDRYLDVSWGHVLYYILESTLGEPKARKKTSPLAKFQSAFHQVYQVQKFWKVPDPQLRSLLRETITKRVISGYRCYLKEHPELEKQVSGGSNSPEVLEEMLGELFEG